MSNRWDRLLDLKRVTLVDQLMTETAKILWEDLGTWPPPLQELEAAGKREFAALLAPDSAVPKRNVYVEGIRLARWDLQRDFDAFDEYVRNRKYLDASLDDTDKPAILFIASFLTESLLALSEVTEGRVKRTDLVLALDRLQRKFETVA